LERSCDRGFEYYGLLREGHSTAVQQIAGRFGHVTDLLGGQVQVMFDVLPELIEYIRTGKLRPLAVTTANRLEVLPDVPAVGDFAPDYEVEQLLRPRHAEEHAG
jgi:Tripartite tricarboxylate transporter family receptor